MTARSLLPATLALFVLAGCGGSDASSRADSPTKTQAQRDSAVGRSGLPGSQGVMKALGAADSARARQARIDSAAKSPY
jgi:hypothetical protein